jgi:hypothetical protein
MAEKTTVEVDLDTWQRLNREKKHPNDTFDTVIRRVLDHYQECERAGEE